MFTFILYQTFQVNYEYIYICAYTHTSNTRTSSSKAHTQFISFTVASKVFFNFIFFSGPLHLGTWCYVCMCIILLVSIFRLFIPCIHTYGAYFQLNRFIGKLFLFICCPGSFICLHAVRKQYYLTYFTVMK